MPSGSTAGRRRRRPGCLWCGHSRYDHTGRVHPEVAARFPLPGHPKVKWSASACGRSDCRGCQRYES